MPTIWLDAQAAPSTGRGMATCRYSAGLYSCHIRETSVGVLTPPNRHAGGRPDDGAAALTRLDSAPHMLNQDALNEASSPVLL